MPSPTWRIDAEYFNDCRLRLLQVIQTRCSSEQGLAARSISPSPAITAMREIIRAVAELSHADAHALQLIDFVLRGFVVTTVFDAASIIVIDR